MTVSAKFTAQENDRESLGSKLWGKLIRSDKLKRWTRTLLILFFLALLLWIARYWHFKDFGLYEDDLTVIPKVMGMNGNQYLDLLIDHLLMLHPHGRPLHNSFIYTAAFLGYGNNLSFLYIYGFIINILSVFLFYFLLKRLFDDNFALIGAIAFVLFSADTTQAFLTASFGIRTSLVFLLLALHCYISEKRVLTYVFSLLILFTYEAPFFIILAAPLLAKRWNKQLVKELLVNAAVLFALAISVYGFRTVVGDFRSEGLTFPGIISTPVVHMVEGPLVSLGTYFYRPIQTIRSLNLEIIFAILFACVFLYLVLSFYSQNRFDDFIDWYKRFGWRSIKLLKKQDEISFTKSDRTDRIIKLFIAGILMLVLAYPLTFTIRAYAISGRDTRVHAAAVVGAAVVWACIGWVFIAIGKAYGKRRIVIFLFTVLFALLVGYGFVIQRDYVDAWRYQKTFWTELLDIIPDVGEGDVILIEPSGLVDTRQIAANYWNLPRVLDQIYKYPEEWEYPPRVYRLIPGWEDTIASNGGSFTVNASNVMSPAPYYREVPCSQVIFIETVSGSMQRRVSALNVNGVEYCLKPLDRTDKLYDPGVLYDLIVDW